MSVDTPSQPLVSVIVPIYGVEPYLEECVDSILGQSYPNLEVLLIDDGSPDRCGAICDAYAARDPRVRAIHQTNAGVSAARNHGLDLATGDFILFVDSDDWIDRETVEGYMRIFSEHPDLDVVESRFASSLDPQQVADMGRDIPEENVSGRILEPEVVWRAICLQPGYLYAWPALWNKCYRRSFIGDERLIPGVTYGEDLAFQFRLYRGLTAYYHWGRVNYFYRENRVGAATERKPTLLIPKFRDSYECMKALILDLEQRLLDGAVARGGCLSLSKQRDYVTSRLMNDLIGLHREAAPFYSFRDQLYTLQRPYVSFLKNRPYIGIHSRWMREREIAVHWFWGYMYLYLPLYYAYLGVKRKLGMMR